MSVQTEKLLVLKAFYMGHAISEKKHTISVALDMVETAIRKFAASEDSQSRLRLLFYLLLKAEILILDDALSAVDGRTEHQILHNLRQWGSDRTVIISAHRLSALTEASEILVFNHGTISQRGNHEQLAAKSGWYRDMFRYQQLEAALDDVPQEQEPEDRG